MSEQQENKFIELFV